MSLSNLLTPNNYSLYIDKLSVNNLAISDAGSADFYDTTSVTSMKINHYNGAALQTDNISNAVRFIKIGKTVHCRIPTFATTNVVSGAADKNYLYIWPIPAGYFNASGSKSDLGLQWLQVPDVNQNEVIVDFRYEPNINQANAGVVNQPGIAIRTTRNQNTATDANWPSTTSFRLGEPVTFSYLID